MALCRMWRVPGGLPEIRARNNQGLEASFREWGTRSTDSDPTWSLRLGIPRGIVPPYT